MCKPLPLNFHYIVWIGSAKLVSKVRKFFPFFVKPLISDPEAAKILSLVPPTGPPSSTLVIFFFKVALNTGWNTNTKIFVKYSLNSKQYKAFD